MHQALEGVAAEGLDALACPGQFTVSLYECCGGGVLYGGVGIL
jgi:hypothetical protein